MAHTTVNELTPTSRESIWTRLCPFVETDGLVVDCRLYGERHAPLATGSIAQLTAANFSHAEVRKNLQGVSRQMFSALRHALVANIDSMLPSSVLRARGVKHVALAGLVARAIMSDAVQGVYDGRLEVVHGATAFDCDAAAGAVLMTSGRRRGRRCRAHDERAATRPPVPCS